MISRKKSLVVLLLAIVLILVSGIIYKISSDVGASSKKEDSVSLYSTGAIMNYQFHDLFEIDKGKSGLIDKTGKLVVPEKYDSIDDFQKNGYAIVGNDTDGDGYFSELFGMIDKNGREVLPVKYDSISSFSDGICILQKKGKYYLCDEKLKIGKRIDCSNIDDFSEGMASFSIDSDDTDMTMNGFINTSGEIVIQAKYSHAFPFTNGKCVVADENNSYFIINKDGYKLTDFGKYDIQMVDDKFIYYSNKSNDNDKKIGVMDYSGKVVVSPRFSNVDLFQDGYSVVTINWKNGIIDETGKYLKKPASVGISNLGGGYFAITKSDLNILNEKNYYKSAIFNSKGQRLTDYLYYNVVRYNDGTFSVTDGKYTFLLDSNGKKIERQKKYFGVGEIWDLGDVTKAYIDGVLTYYDKTGKVIWKKKSVKNLGNNIYVKKTINRINYYTLVKYPVITGIKDTKALKQVNEKLKKLFDFSDSDEDSHIYVNIDFEASINNKILTVMQTDSYYGIGAAHGAHEKTYHHFDIRNGKMYNLSDLFMDKSLYQKSINTIIGNQIKNNEYLKSSIYETNSVSIHGNQTIFDISKNELNIYFSEYEIAPYSEGMPVFNIKFSQLNNIIDKNGAFWKALKDK